MNFLFNINVCRVCMENDQSCDLWSNKILLAEFEFTTRLAISEEDNLPKAICSKCTARLKVAYTFIKSAHESEKNLKIFLTKINTEFKEVTQGNKSSKNSSNEENLSEDYLLSLIDEDNHKDTLAANENKKEYFSPDKNTTKGSTKLEFEQFKTTKKETLKSNEEDFDYSKKDETVYHLSKDILLIHSKNNATHHEYESNTQFMEISSNDDEEQKENEHYEDLQKDNEDDKTFESINILEINDESDIHSQTTELAMHETEENLHYEMMVNRHEDTTQYQRIYVDETSIDDENIQKNDNLYISGFNEEENEMQETSINEDTVNNQIDTVTNSFAKTENIVHRFYCEKCNRDFSTKTNLNRHMQSHEGKKPFSCTECTKSFTQKSTLKQHMYTHTGEKPYVCEVCNRGFTQCKSLIFHMRRHTGEKPFHCEYCLITFRQKDALRIHILKHHVLIEQSMDGSELFTCIICQKKFNSKDKFKTHMKAHTAAADVDNVVEIIKTEEDWPPMKKIKNLSDSESDFLPFNSDHINAAVVNVSASSAAEPGRAKKFQCRKCFKCFGLKKSLIRHMRIHYVVVNNDDDLTAFCELQFPSTEEYQEHLSEYACSD